MHKNVVIDGIEYTPVQKNKPLVFYINRYENTTSGGVYTYKEKADNIEKPCSEEWIRVMECPEGSMVLNKEIILDCLNKHIKVYGVIDSGLYLAMEKTLKELGL